MDEIDEKTQYIQGNNRHAERTVFLPPSISSVVEASAQVDSKTQPASVPGNSEDDYALNTVISNGRFRLCEKLGQGGMGTVYKAIDLHDDNHVGALKLLNRQFRKHPEAIACLKRESRKTQTLSHPKIVNVHDFYLQGDSPFIKMEYLQGEALNRLLARHPDGLPMQQALAILHDICEALGHAHSLPIAHADFKPGNVFVTQQGISKVFDFGIARALPRWDQPTPAALQGYDPSTKLGAMTPAYASAERLQGQSPTLADDVYALGCVAYQLFGGQHPFNKLPADQAQQQHLKPKPLRQLRRHQWRAVQRALAFDSQQRFGQAQEFTQAFFAKPKSYVWLPTVLIGSMAVISTSYLLIQRVDRPLPPVSPPPSASIPSEPWIIPPPVTRTAVQEDNSALEQENRQLARDAIDLALKQLLSDPGSEPEVRAIVQKHLARLPVQEQQQYQDEAASGLIALAQQQMQQIQGQLHEADFQSVEELLAQAETWDSQVPQLDDAHAMLSQLKQQQLKLQQQQQQQQQAEAARRAQQQRQQQIEQSIHSLRQVVLRCENSGAAVNVSSLASRYQAVQRLSAEAAQQQQPWMIEQFSQCINRSIPRNPDQAERIKQTALTLLPQSTQLAGIVIDHCLWLPAGSGGRGERYRCWDALKQGGSGPDMVVIQGSKRPFVISKYEINWADFSRYCRATGQCSNLPLTPEREPVQGLSVNNVQQYIHWLSQQTGFAYRLPSSDEWRRAANNKGQDLDSNQNCAYTQRGFHLGGSLLNVDNGKPNAQGVVNIVGNVQEWVLDADNQLYAVGGSIETPMQHCLKNFMQLRQKHSGKADKLTGFRLVRDLSFPKE